MPIRISGLSTTGVAVEDDVPRDHIVITHHQTREQFDHDGNERLHDFTHAGL